MSVMIFVVVTMIEVFDVRSKVPNFNYIILLVPLNEHTLITFTIGVNIARDLFYMLITF